MTMRFAGVVLCGARILAGQPGAVVTEKMQIRIDGRVQTARKINGRWWSQDNRELKRTNATWLWDISGGNARELVRFDHHYPFDASKVNLVDRSMGPDQVKAVLGAPNSIFPSDRPEQQQHWDYYGPDGYKLSIQFSASGEGIFTASFQPDAGARPQDVPHLTFRFSSRFNGKTTQESFEESKQKGPTRAIPGSTAKYRAQLMAEMAARRAGLQTRASAMVENASAATPAQPLPPARKLTADEIRFISIGMTRAQVIELLGEPFFRSAITGGDGTRETLRYQTQSGRTISLILVDGKLVQAPQ